jgi:hypothetical protein
VKLRRPVRWFLFAAVVLLAAEGVAIAVLGVYLSVRLGADPAAAYHQVFAAPLLVMLFSFLLAGCVLGVRDAWEALRCRRRE